MHSSTLDVHKLTALDYRDAMSEVPTSVNVVTTIFEGQRFGFTASAVCSVSDDPPTLLVCLNRASSSFRAFAGATHFCVNTLAPDQITIAENFGGKRSGGERFAEGNWTQGMGGLPVLEGAVAHFECQLTQSLDIATHRVLFGKTLAADRGRTDDALIYHQRRFIRVDPALAI